MSIEDALAVYDRLIDQCPRFERKGKTMFFTSSNGHMFSILNKSGEIGIRFSKARQQEYFEKYQTTHIKSYGAVMQGYILVTDHMLADTDDVIALLNESHDYVNALDPK